jgi:MarR family transcriptional regulator, 2-MHQ and catechol-resistance regulon repressor
MKTDVMEKIPTLAEDMARLTCELAKTCNEKENNFAAMFDLTPAEFKCLKLFTRKSVVPIKELTSKLGLTPGRITHILTSLEAKKYVVRKNDSMDKRNIQVFLTPKSEPFIKDINEKHIKIHEDILEKIDYDKRESVVSAMKDVIVALNLWNKQVDNIQNKEDYE